ncbi:MAG: hypothetical protein AAF773_00175 [Cyanobacteria bacterium P01_D01_bin.115]
MNTRPHHVTFCDSVEDADHLFRSVCDRRPEYDLSIFTVHPVSGACRLYACTTLYRKRWAQQASEVMS